MGRHVIEDPKPRQTMLSLDMIGQALSLFDNGMIAIVSGVNKRAEASSMSADRPWRCPLESCYEVPILRPRKQLNKQKKVEHRRLMNGTRIYMLNSRLLTQTQMAMALNLGLVLDDTHRATTSHSTRGYANRLNVDSIINTSSNRSFICRRLQPST